MKNTIMQILKAWLIMLFLSAFMNTAFAAPLANDLQGLLTEAQAMDAQLASITLTDASLCSDLLNAHQSADTLITNIASVNASLNPPVTIDIDSLQALDDLSTVIASIATNSTDLSSDLIALNSTSNMLTISNGLTAMLRLSSDIGIMADRILEMSDKILVMADNIGLMADRIIVSQQIQSDNIALTQASILATQQNTLSLVSLVNTSTYNIDFNSQTLTGTLLSGDITTILLTPFNMANQWATVASDIESLTTQVKTTHAAITSAAAENTMYVDVDSYTALVDMSIMVNSIAVATQGLALATEALSPTTSDITLSDSMGSILQLSSDIGVMADRILEMADLILAMADNIGLTADQIIAAQQLQSANYATTLASVEITQSIVIGIIALNSL